MVVKPDGTLTVRYKMINKTELNEFISLYVENEAVCNKERELRKIFEKVSNNNLNITNEDIARAIAKIDYLIKSEPAVNNTEPVQDPTSASSGDELASRIRKLKVLFEEGLIDKNEFNEKKKEILASL